MKNLNEILTSTLEEKGMSQADLVRATGISSAQVAHIVTGRTKDPAFSFVVSIAEALGVSLDYLAGRDMKTVRYSDAYKQKLCDDFDMLSVDGKKSVLEQVEFQLTRRSKSKDTDVSGAA